MFPLRAPNMGGRGGRGRASTNAGRRWKRPSVTFADAEGEGDGEGGRNFWSVDHMVALIRAKQDQDAQLQAAGHAFARMRSREWKWLDVRERLLKVGVDRSADKCGKKWDNLMQQFKKIHTFMGMSGKEDFFQLTSQQRAEKDSASTWIGPSTRRSKGRRRGATLSARAMLQTPVAQEDVQAAQDVGKHPPMRAPSNPATPTVGQARRDEGAGVNAAVRGQLATHIPAKEAAAVGAVVGTSTTCAGGGGGDGRDDADDDDPLINRQRRSRNMAALEAKAKLWVDDLRFWNETEGHGMFKIIQETRLHLIAIAKGVKPPEIRKSVVLPNVTIPQQKLEDVSKLGPAKERTPRVQTIALRIIHGWIFKSPNRARGYHCSYGYVLNHVATDLARAIWFGEDWRVCVSPAVVHNTLELHMKLPIWYVGGVIHDRHEDDEMASYQESTTQRLVGAFTNAVDTGEGVDGGRISYERLRNVADCMRLLLSAAMWIMRMAGDNLRSHYEASHLVELIAKPTLIASLHRSFDARRHVLRCVNAVTEKMGKPPMTLVDPPVYIPDWVSCGVSFHNDATLTSPELARRLDWLGTGPPEIDDEDEEKDEGGES
ncbi:hypothetical protein CBR_g8019 [Chara braunii]|uniref:Myb/SANT-like DNA-binding domain-containing protein n=1 Tax=Chara braunii TaxID=69332 RepID=A0A388KKZ2_CHABU|nr:hypothetical protein CBR_g8019 [Chara braunii]|eukprot:GBG70720.1 hypothetical protein CBR_g8019 [Chara braunii]